MRQTGIFVYQSWHKLQIHVGKGFFKVVLEIVLEVAEVEQSLVEIEYPMKHHTYFHKALQK